MDDQKHIFIIFCTALDKNYAFNSLRPVLHSDENLSYLLAQNKKKKKTVTQKLMWKQSPHKNEL